MEAPLALVLETVILFFRHYSTDGWKFFPVKGNGATFLTLRNGVVRYFTGQPHALISLLHMPVGWRQRCKVFLQRALGAHEIGVDLTCDRYTE